MPVRSWFTLSAYGGLVTIPAARPTISANRRESPRTSLTTFAAPRHPLRPVPAVSRQARPSGRAEVDGAGRRRNVRQARAGRLAAVRGDRRAGGGDCHQPAVRGQREPRSHGHRLLQIDAGLPRSQAAQDAPVSEHERKFALMKYGAADGQIGALSSGDLDAVLTSPPYAESVDGRNGIEPREDWRGARLASVQPGLRRDWGTDRSPPRNRQRQRGADVAAVPRSIDRAACAGIRQANAQRR